MARNMIEENSQFFNHLIQYCLRSDIHLGEGKRYLSRGPVDTSVLKYSAVREVFKIGTHKAIVSFEYGIGGGGRTYVGVSGFPSVDENMNSMSYFGTRVRKVSSGPGGFIRLVNESKIEPSATPDSVADYVAFGHIGEGDYCGHHYIGAAELFPQVDFYEVVVSTEEWKFNEFALCLCASENYYGGGWIDENLKDSLIDLAISVKDPFPYEFLARSIVGLDPRILFLALYRCIEAAYSRKQATDLKVALGVNIPWFELAVHVMDKTSWRVKEYPSMKSLLSQLDEELVLQVGSLFPEGDTDQISKAAERIYGLRNSIVHFGPSRSAVDLNQYDWTGICSGMCKLASGIYIPSFLESS